VASICQVELPEGIYDGTDVKAAFLGKELKRSKELFWTHAGSVAMLSQNWKGILTKAGEFTLYDIEQDPAELNNLAGNHPEVAKEIEKSIQSWKKEMSID